MCDIISGELLVSFHKLDHAALRLIERIKGDGVPHVQVIESLDDKLRRADLRIREDLNFLFYRLKVPPGEEVYKINYLQFFYKIAFLEALSSGHINFEKHGDIVGTSNYHLQIVPNSILSIATKVLFLGYPSFTFTQTHKDYKQMLEWKALKMATPSKKIAILDTGVDNETRYNIIAKNNFIDYANLNDVYDDNGHGTVVTSIIKDMCSTAELIIYKVADNKGRASEWDTLAALAVSNNANLINISLTFGLPDKNCPICGRESRSSRSAVFENMIYQLQNIPKSPLIIAAAGNDSRNELSFPARFGSVLAIESIDSSGQLSDFSNRSTQDHFGNSHENVFVLPGGQKFRDKAAIEIIGKSAGGEEYYGTSFSAAYASGLIGAMWSSYQHSQRDSYDMLKLLKSNSEKKLSHYDPATYGNGMMKFF